MGDWPLGRDRSSLSVEGGEGERSWTAGHSWGAHCGLRQAPSMGQGVTLRLGTESCLEEGQLGTSTAGQGHHKGKSSSERQEDGDVLGEGGSSPQHGAGLATGLIRPLQHGTPTRRQMNPVCIQVPACSMPGATPTAGNPNLRQVRRMPPRGRHWPCEPCGAQGNTLSGGPAAWAAPPRLH